MSELDTLSIKMLLPEVNIEDSASEVENIHNAIRGTEDGKENLIKRFSTLREILSPKISILQRQLEECLVAKASYDKFSYTNLSAMEVASYALFFLIYIFNTIKKNCKKEVERLKLVYVDYFSEISSWSIAGHKVFVYNF